MKQKSLIEIILIAVLIHAYCNAQKSDFIVTTAHDTIYVDKVSLTDFEIKTKKGKEKKRYAMDEVINYYLYNENKHFERIALEKKEPKPIDRYDYQRNDNLYSEEYNYRKKYKYIQRLTTGKVKIFTELSTPGLSTITMYDNTPDPSFNMPGAANMPTGGARRFDIYYISVYDSKFEVISDYGKLKLTPEVYDILKIYLYGNPEITRQLDDLLALKRKADEEDIINLINRYNVWARSNK